MKNTQTRSIQLSNYVRPDIVEVRDKDWVLNGHNNSFFQDIIDRYNGSPTNAALIDAYADRVYGKGLSIVNAKQNASEYASLLTMLPRKEVRKIVTDFKLFGSAVMQVRYGKGSKRTIAKVEHIDRQMVAPAKVNKKGEIDTYYVCKDWKNTTKEPPKPYKAWGYSTNDAIEIAEIKPYKAGRTYYSDPDYLAGMQYAKLEEEIANFSVNHIMNGLSMGWVLNYNDGIPPEEVQEDIERRVIARTTGSSNAGRVIINFNDNKDTAPTVDAIPDNANHEQWQFWANEARQQLMVAHRVTTPMLFGIKDNTGLGNNANELKEGTKLLHETTIRPIQNEILDLFEEFAMFNNIASPLRFVPLEDEEEQEEKVKEVAPVLVPPQPPQPQELKMSEDSWATCANYLVSLGDVVDDYEEVDTRNVNGHTLTEDKLNTIIQLAAPIGGDSRKASEHDTSLFKIRYKYAGSLTAERAFCRIVMASNKVYRYEDLKAAENKIVNEGFGPNGTDKYNIFLYKGGVNCKHWWQRVIYLKKGNKRIGVNEARRMINELEPSDRPAAKWEENPKEVAQIASPSNNNWRLN